MIPTTEGTLLGGRLVYRQPAEGFRTGVEPVLLAASVPARPGERVLEAGTGAGAGLLCLADRVKGLAGTGVEIDPAMADLAVTNLAANAIADVAIVAGDLLEQPRDAGFDHAFANPPYHASGGTRSPSAARERAKRGRPGLVAAWTEAMAAMLRPRGTLTLVLAAAAVPEALAAADRAACGSPSLFPLWPKADRPAKLVLVRWVKGGRGPLRLSPGLVLHLGDRFTAAADRILRGGGALLL